MNTVQYGGGVGVLGSRLQMLLGESRRRRANTALVRLRTVHDDKSEDGNAINIRGQQ